MTTAPHLNILHVLRAPVGGLFRHVADLARAQSAAGHRVGVICCSQTSDRLTEARLAALADALALGLQRIPMAREIDARDIAATRAVRSWAQSRDAHVLHGHGAKGGAYARLAAAGLKREDSSIAAVYTPHGGSLHYAPSSLKGRIFMALERHLAGKTDGLIFESAHSAQIYAQNVAPRVSPATRIIPNGIGPEELIPVSPRPDAADFVFVGELRHLKGVDLLLDALALLTPQGPATAVVVGDGPDAATFKAQADQLGLADRVRFPGAMPARQAFALGRSLVMPSRAESFPYVVLEAGAAALPMIATAVGGIPEITRDSGVPLIPSEDTTALAAAMRRHIDDRSSAAAEAQSLRLVIADRFTIARMTSDVLDFYRTVLTC